MPDIRSSSLLHQLRQMVGNPTNLETPDGFLLESFVAERDQAAFDRLLKRHAPMVYRTCLRIVRDPHHAEDAFQATFLVLCRKARSIRRQDSVAGWLYQVAARISLKLRADSQRQVSLDDRGPDVTAPENPCLIDAIDFRLALDEELSRLPEKYRAPLILHYLESKPAVAVARELGWPYGTVLGRMARGRDKLRARFLRRGISLGVESVWAVELARFVGQGSLPMGLAKATTKVASLLALGRCAAPVSVAPQVAELAQGMGRAMLLAKLKTGLYVLVAAVGFAAATGLSFSYLPAAPTPKPSASDQAAATRPPTLAQSKDQEPKYRMTGSVRLEGTGEPVAGATIQVRTGIVGEESDRSLFTANSREDGSYAINLVAGNIDTSFVPPAGYLSISGRLSIDSIALTRAEPVARIDFLVRRGTRWNFRATNGAKTPALPGVVTAFSSKRPTGSYRGLHVDGGLICLTLPTDAGETSARIQKELRGGAFSTVDLEWEAGFRTGSVKSIARLDGTANRFRLTDIDGRTALVASGDKAEPVKEGTNLIIQVALEQSESGSQGELAGQVFDETGKPLEKALVSLIYVYEKGTVLSSDKQHQARTDAQGRYRLPSIARRFTAQKPVNLQLTVTRDGYAGIDTPTFRFEPPDRGPQVADPVRLTSGLTIKGTALDPEGRPVAGAWVVPTASYALYNQFTKTDEAGGFVVRDLPAGMVPLNFTFGKLSANGKYWAERDSQAVVVRLKSPPVLEAGQEVRVTTDLPKPAPPANLLVGAAAPEWETGPWSDGASHKLQNLRGKVVFLDFWGIRCGPCLEALPRIEKLRAKYERRGVVFLSIHTPGDDDKTIRKVLDSKKISLTFALDRAPAKPTNERIGVSSERYAIYGYPTCFLIDRTGKIAFRSDDPGNKAEYFGIMKSLGYEESTLTAEQAGQVAERFAEQVIERVLKQK